MLETSSRDYERLIGWNLEFLSLASEGRGTSLCLLCWVGRGVSSFGGIDRLVGWGSVGVRICVSCEAFIQVLKPCSWAIKLRVVPDW